MCADNEQVQGDKLYPAELTDVLGPSESVNILGLDVCSMAGLENLYQWRPGESKFGADYVIASAPLSGAWAYDEILGRLGTDQSKLDEGEEFIDPSTVGPKKLASLFYEEIKQNQVWASWALVDNSFIKEVKTAFDALGIALTLENDTLVYQHIKSTLAYHHNTSNDEEIARIGFPYLDAYHFCSAIKNDVQFNKNTRLKAQLCLNSLDRLTMDSYYGRGYLPETENFEEGKSGLYLIVPLGKEIFSQSSWTYWTHTSWYHPNDQSEQGNAYGKYDWCIDGAISGNNKVENWYEYLDSLFDEENDAGGGVNQYQW
jgi:clostripain